MRILVPLLIVAGYVPTAAHAACQHPSPINVPGGARSTLEDLLAAQSDVKSYFAEMEDYLACINAELTTDGENAPADFNSELTSMHSSAVMELETVAAAFSQELRAFWNAHPELKAEQRTQPGLRP